jgi:hypothetical protein
MSEMELVLELMVIGNSSIAGMTVREVEDKYGLRIIHMHKGISEDMVRYNPPKDKKVEAGWYVKVVGPYDLITSFGVIATSPANP